MINKSHIGKAVTFIRNPSTADWGNECGIIGPLPIGSTFLVADIATFGEISFVRDKDYRYYPVSCFSQYLYKFKIGDTVKVVQGGEGIHPDKKGQIVTITGLGEYFSHPGYQIFPAIGNDLDMYNGEESFELYKEPKAELESIYKIGGYVKVIKDYYDAKVGEYWKIYEYSSIHKLSVHVERGEKTTLLNTHLHSDPECKWVGMEYPIKMTPLEKSSSWYIKYTLGITESDFNKLIGSLSGLGYSSRSHIGMPVDWESFKCNGYIRTINESIGKYYCVDNNKNDRLEEKFLSDFITETSVEQELMKKAKRMYPPGTIFSPAEESFESKHEKSVQDYMVEIGPWKLINGTPGDLKSVGDFFGKKKGFNEEAYLNKNFNKRLTIKKTEKNETSNFRTKSSSLSQRWR